VRASLPAPSPAVAAVVAFSAGGVAGFQPARSSSGTAKRTGTAKFASCKPSKMPKLMPMTRPDWPKRGAPDPPSAVRAS
jgi:hypothetical protein